MLGRSGKAAGGGWWRKWRKYVACSISSDDVVSTDIGRMSPYDILDGRSESNHLARVDVALTNPSAIRTFTRQLAPQNPLSNSRRYVEFEPRTGTSRISGLRLQVGHGVLFDYGEVFLAVRIRGWAAARSLYGWMSLKSPGVRW